MRVLGVDPGSVRTGYGIVDLISGRLSLVDQGTIQTTKGEELSFRLQRIFEGLIAIITLHKPDEVAVETPFAGLNVKSLVQLCQARGVILLAAQTCNLAIHEYSPRSVKSAVVGYGAAEKEQVAKMVRVLLPGCAEMTLGPDAADALAIAICHAHSAGMASRVRIAAGR